MGKDNAPDPEKMRLSKSDLIWLRKNAKKVKIETDNPVELLYHDIASDIAQVVTEKNEAYGDSFGKSGKLLRYLYPDGISVHQYQDMLCIIRIIDKLFRIAADKDAFGESPYRDIAGYALLGVAQESKA